MEDEAVSEPEWSVPAGAPFRVYQWLVPPLVLVLLAGIVAYGTFRVGPPSAPTLPIVATAVLLVVATGLGIFGYRAYRDLSRRAVDQFVWTKVISLAVIGAVLSYGPFGFPLLAWAGHSASTLRLTFIDRRISRMPAHRWHRVTVIAAAISVVGFVLLPLALGLESVPLIALALTGRIAAPFVFGFALRLRQPA